MREIWEEREEIFSSSAWRGRGEREGREEGREGKEEDERDEREEEAEEREEEAEEMLSERLCCSEAMRERSSLSSLASLIIFWAPESVFSLENWAERLIFSITALRMEESICEFISL